MTLTTDGLFKEKEPQVNRTLPLPDECRLIFLHLIRQAIDDYHIFKDRKSAEDKEVWETAAGFLFDDNYTIDWGTHSLTLKDICQYLNLNTNWLRQKLIHHVKIRLDKNGIISVEALTKIYKADYDTLKKKLRPGSI